MFGKRHNAAPVHPELAPLHEQEEQLQKSINTKKQELAELQQESTRAAENHADVLVSRQQDIDRIDVTLAAKRDESQHLDEHLDRLKRDTTFESVVLDERTKEVNAKELKNAEQEKDLRSIAKHQEDVFKQLSAFQFDLNAQKESILERERSITPVQEKLKTDRIELDKLIESAKDSEEHEKNIVIEAMKLLGTAKDNKAKTEQMLAEAEESKIQSEEIKTKTKLLYEEAQRTAEETVSILESASAVKAENEKEKARLESWREELAAQETDLNRRQRLNGLNNVES